MDSLPTATPRCRDQKRRFNSVQAAWTAFQLGRDLFGSVQTYRGAGRGIGRACRLTRWLGHSSHILIRCSTRRSTLRRATDLEGSRTLPAAGALGERDASPDLVDRQGGGDGVPQTFLPAARHGPAGHWVLERLPMDLAQRKASAGEEWIAVDWRQLSRVADRYDVIPVAMISAAVLAVGSLSSHRAAAPCL